MKTISEYSNTGWSSLNREDLIRDKRLMTSKNAFDHVRNYHFRLNDIGKPGHAGFGTGTYPVQLPSGFTELSGTHDVLSPEYGNYLYLDGSVMVWKPAFYYRIGHPSNPTFSMYGSNSVDIKPEYHFNTVESANANGYVLHRAFVNANKKTMGFMIDKFQCSDNAGIASSIRNRAPLTCSSDSSPLSALHNSPTNTLGGAWLAAKSRGPMFHVATRFQYAACALLSLAHGQAATSSQHCAWYSENRTSNFPKGNNNGAFGDVNDNTLYWQPSGYSSIGNTGSPGVTGDPNNIFAKTTDNGQHCGVADLNGNIWEITQGITKPGATEEDNSTHGHTVPFFVIKTSIDVNQLTGTWNQPFSAFGNTTHLSTLYDNVQFDQFGVTSSTFRFGNSATPTAQVLSNLTTNPQYTYTGLGIYNTNRKSVNGINLFGNDIVYEAHTSNLCAVSGGQSFGLLSGSGIWTLDLRYSRARSDAHTGFRASAYLE